MKSLANLLIIMLALLSLSSEARESVTLPYTVHAGQTGEVQAVLRKPAGDGNGQALLLLHHAGGFDVGTTTPYAELFAARGFVTLELKMFGNVQNRPPRATLYAMMASGLAHLSRQPGVQPDKVSAVGFSLGAFMTIAATSRWFYEHHALGELRFHRLAALYPVCWMMSEAVRGDIRGLAAFEGMPANFLQQLAGIPLLILAGGKDNYDGSNPNACPEFAAAMPDARQAQITQVKVYPEATHGWDHGWSYHFMVWGGCPGRTNCRNHNISSPETVAKGRQDLLAFLLTP